MTLSSPLFFQTRAPVSKRLFSMYFAISSVGMLRPERKPKRPLPEPLPESPRKVSRRSNTPPEEDWFWLPPPRNEPMLVFVPPLTAWPATSRLANSRMQSA